MHDTPLRASAARTRTAANHSLPSSKNRTCTSSTVAYAMVKPPFLSLPPFSIWHLPPILCSSPSLRPQPALLLHSDHYPMLGRFASQEEIQSCHPFFFRPTSGRASHPHCHHPSSPLIAWISKLSNPCLSRCAPRGWQTGTTNSSSIRSHSPSCYCTVSDRITHSITVDLLSRCSNSMCPSSAPRTACHQSLVVGNSRCASSVGQLPPLLPPLPQGQDRPGSPR